MRITNVMGQVLAAIGILAVGGCLGRGHDLTYDQAQTYFASHRDQLEAIIKTEEACQPVYQHGDVAIRVDEITAIPCVNGDHKAVLHMRERMRKAGVEMLFTRHGNSTGRVSEFLMHSEGLGVSGSGTFIVNTAASSTPSDISLDKNQDVRPMKAAPEHWFWGKGWT